MSAHTMHKPLDQTFIGRAHNLAAPDLAMCRRLAQEAVRRASAAESWACLVFGRLGRERVSIEFARELAELAEKDAAELRRLTANLVYQLKGWE